MKKITCLAVLAACALCITGCGKDENPSAEKAKSDAASIAEKAKADVSKAANKAGEAAGKAVDSVKNAFK